MRQSATKATAGVFVKDCRRPSCRCILTLATSAEQQSLGEASNSKFVIIGLLAKPAILMTFDP